MLLNCLPDCLPPLADEPRVFFELLDELLHLLAVVGHLALLEEGLETNKIDESLTKDYFKIGKFRI